MAGLRAGRANTPPMEQSTAQRRLVKSPPELWAEVSSEDILGRHLSEFGEIHITRVDPETTVAWEGDRASGTVELAPAGWGTRVVLTATPVPPQEIAAVVSPEPEPVAAAEPVPAPRPAARRGFFARLFRRQAPAAEIPAPGPPIHDPSPPTPAPDPMPPDPGPVPAPDPTPPIDPVPPAPEPGPAPLPPSIVLDPGRTVAILTDVLDDLGAAHRRPSLSHD